MGVREDRKQERSLSVTARADVTTLMRLGVFWEERGVPVKTMSGLIRFSLDLVKDILAESGEVRKVDVSVGEAVEWFNERGIAKGAMKRNRKKIAAAIGFDNLRAAGIDPRSYVPTQYNILHNKHSVGVNKVEMVKHKVIVPDNFDDLKPKYLDDLIKCDERIREEEVRESKEIKDDKVKAFIESNGVGTGEDKVIGWTEDNLSNKPLQSDQLTKPTLPPAQENQETQGQVRGEQNSEDQSLDTINSGIVISEKWSEEQVKAKMDEIKLRDREREEMEMREIKKMMEQSDNQPGE